MYLGILQSLQKSLKDKRYSELNLNALLEPLNEIVSISETYLTKEGENYPKIDKENLDKLNNAYKKFFEENKKVLGKELPVDLKVMLSEVTKPMGMYQKNLSNLKEGDTIEKAYKDLTWVKGLFDMPTEIEDNHLIPTEVNGVEDAFKKFTEATADVYDKYQEYVKKVAKTDENSIEVITYRSKMIDYIITDYKGLSKQGNAFFSPVSSSLPNLDNTLNIKNLQSNKKSLTFGAFYFDMNVQDFYEAVDGYLNKYDLTPEEYKDLKADLKCMRFKTGYIGFEKENLKAIDIIKQPLTFTNDRVNILEGIMATEPEIVNALESLKGKYNGINEKIVSALKSGDSKLLPKEEEYKGLINGILDVCKVTPTFRENFDLNEIDSKMDETLLEMTESLRELADNVPTLKKDVDLALENLKARVIKDTNKEINKVLSEINSHDVEVSFLNVENAYKNRFISKAELDNTRFMRMIKDPAFRNSEFERAKNAIIYFAERNEGKNPYHFDAIDEKENIRPKEDVFKDAYKILYFAIHLNGEQEKGLNPLFKGPFTTGVISPDDSEKMREYVNGFFDSPVMGEMLKMGPTEVKKLEDIQDKNVIRQLLDRAIRGKNMYEEIGVADIGILTNEGRNSDEYNTLKDAILDLQKTSFMPGGASNDGLLTLYDAAKRYVYTHDTVPSTKDGKKRANAALNVMYKVGKELVDRMPALATTINHDFKANMVRSADFRSLVLMDSVNLKSSYEQGRKITDADLNKMKPSNRAKYEMALHNIVFAQGINESLGEDYQVTAKLPKEMNKEVNYLIRNHDVERMINLREAEVQTIKADMTVELNNALKGANPPLYDPNIKLKEGIAKIIINEEFKAKIGNEFSLPRELKEYSKALNLALSRENINKLMASEDFLQMYNGLSIDGLKCLSNTNDMDVAKDFYDKYCALKDLHPVEKIVAYSTLRNERIGKMQGNELFFDNFPEGYCASLTKYSGISSDRTGYHTLGVAMMLEQGYTLEDILDPLKLRNERAEISSMIIDAHFSMNENDFKTFYGTHMAKGLKIYLDEFDQIMNKLPDVDAKTLTSAQNEKIMLYTSILNDMGQEASRAGIQKEAGIKVLGQELFDSLIDRQTGAALAIQHTIEKYDYMEKVKNGDPNGIDFSGDVQKLIGKAAHGAMISKQFKAEKNKPGFSFSTYFKAGSAPLLKGFENVMGGIINDERVAQIGDYLTENPDKVNIFLDEIENGEMLQGKNLEYNLETHTMSVKNFNKNINKLADRKDVIPSKIEKFNSINEKDKVKTDRAFFDRRLDMGINAIEKRIADSLKKTNVNRDEVVQEVSELIYLKSVKDKVIETGKPVDIIEIGQVDVRNAGKKLKDVTSKLLGNNLEADKVLEIANSKDLGKYINNKMKQNEKLIEEDLIKNDKKVEKGMVKSN